MPDRSFHGRGHVCLPYTQMKTAPPPLAVERTEGVRLHLADGRVSIDGIASWWTSVYGYNRPRIVAAIAEQAALMPHVMLDGLVHRPVMELTERLAALLPGPIERVFFSDSGSVAVEVAMKMAAQSHRNRGDARRMRFLSFTGNYHGDTFAAMSICGPEKGMHRLFAGVLPEQIWRRRRRPGRRCATCWRRGAGRSSRSSSSRRSRAPSGCGCTTRRRCAPMTCRR